MTTDTAQALAWFAFTDTERIVPLGKHEDFSSADDVAPGNTVWVFRRDSLQELRDRINAALGAQA